MTANAEEQQPQGAAPPPEPRYTARLGTRTTPEMRRRLRTAAAREDMPIQEFLTRLLDRALPTAAELDAGPRNRTEETIAALLAAVASGEVKLEDLEGENTFWAHAARARLAEVGNDQH